MTPESPWEMEPPNEPPLSAAEQLEEELVIITDAVGLAQLELTQALARLTRLLESIESAQ